MDSQKPSSPSENQTIFICGTDTDVGKTYVTSLLCKDLKAFGKNVLMQKWVQTGDADDALVVYEKMDAKGLYERFRELITPYKFNYPSSPHLAARLEGTEVDIDVIIKRHEEIKKHCNILLIEGSGGILVPIREDFLFIDLVKRLSLPAIIVGRAGLGTINHTLLTYRILIQSEIKVKAIVLNNCNKFSDMTIISDNLTIIEKLTGVRVFYVEYGGEINDKSIYGLIDS